MNNPACIQKQDLLRMFWHDSTQSRLAALLEKFGDRFSLQEIHDQMQSGEGEVGEYFKNELKRFSTVTINDEVANALTLSDFYFPDAESSICFEMRSDFQGGCINDFKELADNVETATDIDFRIRNPDQIYDFQLKQYPEEYKEWSVERVLTYIEESVISKYSKDENKGLSIVITIKPTQLSNFKETEDFKQLHELLKDKEIALEEICFLYNRNNEHMVWYQVFPKRGYSKIDFENLSHYRARL
jgi:hypothetical protein